MNAGDRGEGGGAYERWGARAKRGALAAAKAALKPFSLLVLDSGGLSPGQSFSQQPQKQMRTHSVFHMSVWDIESR